MNEMERYLYNHAYVSNVKTCNRQFELSKERAECIANKYNNLVKEKDKEIERLNNIINKIEEYLLEQTKDGFFRIYANAYLSKLYDLKEGK